MNILKSAALACGRFDSRSRVARRAPSTRRRTRPRFEPALQPGPTAYNSGDGDAHGRGLRGRRRAAAAECAGRLGSRGDPGIPGRPTAQTTRGAGLKFDIPGDGPVPRSRATSPTSPGRSSVVDASGADVATGKYIGVFNKMDGKWLLVRDTWNTDAPPPAERLLPIRPQKHPRPDSKGDAHL